MSADGDDRFLTRWSRLKQESRAQTPPAHTNEREPTRPDDGPPDLPPIEALTPDSDFSAFLHPRVEESVRRLALKKLFADPHFNVMDGLDVYIDDYSVSEPLPAGMLEQLEQAKKILGWSREDAERRAADAAGRDAAARGAVTDEAPRAADAPPAPEDGGKA